MTNPTGLVASHPGNRNRETHGLRGRDPRRYDARAAEIEEELFALPHVTPLDGPALREIATLISLIERVDKALSDGRVETGRPRRTNTPHAETWKESFTGRTARGLRPATLDDYKTRLDAYAIPYFGRRRLSSIEPRDVREFSVRVSTHDHEGKPRAKPISQNTIRLAVAPLKALLATAHEEGLIRTNPSYGVRISQRTASDADAERAKAMTEDELRALLAALPESHRLFFTFLAHTGLRIGEAIALRWEDVDLGKRRVMVRRRFYRGSFAPPKSKYGRRDVPISAALSQALWTLRGTKADDELVFVAEGGGMIDQSNLSSRVLKPAAKAAGLGRVSFHTFRHTCASILFRSGLNAKQVQAWLGHHSPAFTLSVYVHLVSDDLPGADFLDSVTGREVPSPAESKFGPRALARLGSDLVAVLDLQG